jgi:hypothetical protein
MAGSIGRSISIGLSANTKNFAKSLRSAEKNLERFKHGVKVLGTAVAASFAAMGAAALLFGKSAITAALEDQKSQVILAKTIKNNAKARKGLIKDSEKTISALESQFNIVDDKLRPAFGKLVTATKSVSKSQKLIRVAIDVSAQSGKSLESVVTALSRAYLGSNTALSKLGLGIDKAQLKTMSFDQLIQQLTKSTGGAGKATAGTYQGAVDGLSIAWQNFQESVGYKILPKLQTMLKYVKTKVVPWLGEVKKGFDGVGKDENSPAQTLGRAIQSMFVSFQNLFGTLSGSQSGQSLSVLDQLATALTTIANAITKVTDAVSKAGAWWGKVGPWVSLLGGRNSDLRPWQNNGSSGTKTPAPPVRRGKGGYSANRMTTNQSSLRGTSMPNYSTGNMTINLNGIVDAESARRSIEQLMQKSSKRTGQVNLNGAIF